MKNRVIELFAGVGGFRVGLNNIESFSVKTGLANEKGNWDFVWANQWEPGKNVQHAFNCYTTRFGNVESHVNKDISTILKSSIPDHDLLVGGFPCQDYSVARSKNNEQGINGKKGVLWWQIYDTLKEKKTPFLLLENVDRLLKSPASHRGRDFAIMLKSLNELGYIVEWRVINAAEYGMPQRRRRVFIFAYRNDTNRGRTIRNTLDTTNYSSKSILTETLLNKEFPAIVKGKLSVKDLTKYKDLVDVTDSYPGTETKFLNSGIMINDKAYHFDITEIAEPIYTLDKVVKTAKKFNSNYSFYEVANIAKWREAKSGKKINRKTKDGYEYTYAEGNMAFPDDLEKPGRTMLTSESTLNRSSHIVYLDKENETFRTITEVEAELLNMFPANWTDSGMPQRSRYFMMGNALVTGIVSRIEKELSDILASED